VVPRRQAEFKTPRRQVLKCNTLGIKPILKNNKIYGNDHNVHVHYLYFYAFARSVGIFGDFVPQFTVSGGCCTAAGKRE